MRVVTIAAVFTVAVATAGCADTDTSQSAVLVDGCTQPAGPIALAAGRSNVPSVTFDQVKQYFAKPAESQSFASLMDTGSSPNSTGSLSFQTRVANDVARKDELAQMAAQVRAGISALTAKSPEANPLGALDVASRLNRIKSATGTIVLADSGLQTTGALDYRNGLIDASADDVANGLKSSGALPDLTGMTVYLIGIGDVAAPQTPLDQARKTNLIEQWRAIITASGASCVAVDPTPLTGAGPAGAPSVSIVNVPPAASLQLASKVVIGDSQVRFKDNSAELKYPDQARTALYQIATALQSSGQKILLTGTTATAGTTAGQLQLSRERAEAVKSILVSLGVDGANIETRGVGVNSPDHVQDLDENGNLIPEKATLNRTVVLTVAK